MIIDDILLNSLNFPLAAPSANPSGSISPTSAEHVSLYFKKELKKLYKEVKNTGLPIVPLRLFINEKGYAKLTISLAKGKKLYDKRQTIKNRENKIEMDRINKIKNTR